MGRKESEDKKFNYTFTVEGSILHEAIQQYGREELTKKLRNFVHRLVNNKTKNHVNKNKVR